MSASVAGRSPAMFRFTSDSYAPRERLAAWREIFGRTVVDIDITPSGDAPFRSDATVCQLPGLGVLFVSTVAMHMEHPRALVRDDDLSFVAAPTARWIAAQRGRRHVLGRGAGVLLSNGEPGAVTLCDAASFVSFRVPRAAIAPLVRDLDEAICRPVAAHNRALRLLVGYLGCARATEAFVSPALQRLATTHVYDLIAVAFGATRDGAEAARTRGLPAARLNAAKAYVVDHLERGNLSAAMVGSELGVTERYIQMLFAREGLSFSEFVLSQRLARAHAMLRDPRHAESTIGSIALAVGFNDLSHFNRSFRRRYGCRPSDTRGQPRRVSDER